MLSARTLLALAGQRAAVVDALGEIAEAASPGEDYVRRAGQVAVPQHK